MARHGLNLSVRQLAELANLNKATIVRIEAGLSVRDSTLRAVGLALEAAGAEFSGHKKHGRVAVSIPDQQQPKSLGPCTAEFQSTE